MRATPSRARRALWSVGAAALVVSAPYVLAQSQPPASTAAGNLLSAGQPAATRQYDQYTGLRATQVIGMSVRNPQGQNIGRIEDMVVNIGNGKVRYAMLRFDPGFFTDERIFAVPMAQLRMAAQRNDLVLDVSRARLEQAAIDRSEWTRDYFADLSRIRRMDEAWGIRDTDTAPVARASDLVGTDLRARDGRVIGELEELVVDASRQQVHYAVASFDRSWLGEDRRVALPLRAFYRSPTADALTLNIGRSDVQAMRAFDQQQYANLNDPVFLVDVDRYLVLVPANRAESTGGAAQGTDVASTSRMESTTAPRQPRTDRN